MAYDVPGFRRSYLTAGDLSASQYKFVKMSGATVVAVAATTDKAVGVLENKPAAAGRAATVMISGVCKVKASKSFAAGVPVFLAADGRVTDVEATNEPVGLAESASSGSDSVVAVLLKPLGTQIGAALP